MITKKKKTYQLVESLNNALKEACDYTRKYGYVGSYVSPFFL